MLCPACNADIPTDSAFCPKCGQQLTRAAVQPASGGTAVLPSTAAAAAPPSPAERLRPGMHPVPHEEEKELWHGGYSSKSMLGGWVFAGLVSVAAVIAAIFLPNPATWLVALIAIVLAWLIPAMKLMVLRLGVEYTLTTQRFLHKKGLLRRVADQILLVDIDDISYEQGPMGRVLNFGTITLLAKDLSLRTKDSKDPSNEKLTLVPVDDVQRVANLIDEARREERRKRAIYMANA